MSKHPLLFPHEELQFLNATPNTPLNNNYYNNKAAMELQPNQFTSPIRKAPPVPNNTPNTVNYNHKLEQMHQELYPSLKQTVFKIASSPNYRHALLMPDYVVAEARAIIETAWAGISANNKEQGDDDDDDDVNNNTNNNKNDTKSDVLKRVDMADGGVTAAENNKNNVASSNPPHGNIDPSAPRKLPNEDCIPWLDQQVNFCILPNNNLNNVNNNANHNNNNNNNNNNNKKHVLHQTSQQLQQKLPKPHELDVYSMLNPKKTLNMGYREKIVSWLSHIPHLLDTETNEITMDCYPGVVADNLSSNISSLYSTSAKEEFTGPREIDLADIEDLLEFQAQKITRYVTRLYGEEFDSNGGSVEKDCANGKAEGGVARCSEENGAIAMEEDMTATFPIAESTNIP